MNKILIETRIHFLSGNDGDHGTAEIRTYGKLWNNYHNEFSEITKGKWDSSASASVERAHTMNTLSGRRINILNPVASDFTLEDIAAGLANKPHYSGQTPHFFSVAQHSVLVAEYLLEKNPFNYRLAQLALLHDAEEAYLGDMISPMKKLFPLYEHIAKNFKYRICDWARIASAVASKYSVGVKHADNLINAMESRFFYGENGWGDVTPETDFPSTYWEKMSPETAKQVFITRYNFYTQSIRNAEYFDKLDGQQP